MKSRSMVRSATEIHKQMRLLKSMKIVLRHWLYKSCVYESWIAQCDVLRVRFRVELAFLCDVLSLSAFVRVIWKFVEPHTRIKSLMRYSFSSTFATLQQTMFKFLCFLTRLPSQNLSRRYAVSICLINLPGYMSFYCCLYPFGIHVSNRQMCTKIVSTYCM